MRRPSICRSSQARSLGRPACSLRIQIIPRSKLPYPRLSCRSNRPLALVIRRVSLTKRIRFCFACFSALCIALFATGCAGGSSAPPAPPPPLPVSVSLSSTTASVQAGIGTQKFTATVQNDPQSKGINWTLTQSGANCSPGCGTLSATSSASGTPITYTAPSNQPNPSDVMLTAISVADSTKSQVATITVTPSVVVSVSPTTINVQFNAIQDCTA